MNTLRQALTLLSVIALAVPPALAATPPRDATPANHSLAPYFTPATAAPKAPTHDGFIQRWLLLEPITKPNRSNAGFVESYIRRELTREYFAGQFTTVPRDGEKVMAHGGIVDDPAASARGELKVQVRNEELTWHAVDATGFNVKLFRFASGLEKPVYGVLFWAVTVIDCPREMANVRLAVGSNSASLWWLNGEEAVGLFGDRRMVMDDGVSPRLTLKQGRNVLRGAVINGPGMSDFCVRFIDEAGGPVTDFTIVLPTDRNEVPQPQKTSGR